MNRFVQHQMLTTFKEFRADCHRHFKKYSDSGEARANLPNHWLDVMRIDTSSATTISAEQSRTNKTANRSSLTIIVADPSHFYNDSTSSLREKGSRSIVWSCFGKRTFKLRRSCRRPPRMRIKSKPFQILLGIGVSLINRLIPYHSFLIKEKKGTRVIVKSNSAISDSTSTRGRSGICRLIHRPSRSNRAPSSFREVILPSAIQLLSTDDRASAVKSTAMVGVIEHLLQKKKLTLVDDTESTNHQILDTTTWKPSYSPIEMREWRVFFAELTVMIVTQRISTSYDERRGKLEIINGNVGKPPISPLCLVPKMISILSRQFGHSHPYKSKDNPSQTGVHNTLKIKTKSPRCKPLRMGNICLLFDLNGRLPKHLSKRVHDLTCSDHDLMFLAQYVRHTSQDVESNNHRRVINYSSSELRQSQLITNTKITLIPIVLSYRCSIKDSLTNLIHPVSVTLPCSDPRGTLQQATVRKDNY
uniref:CACTA en-spm transposon protein n=1 Tax=Cucumis melo TaxID=3656 RepID=A0A9I9EH47_CUCME